MPVKRNIITQARKRQRSLQAQLRRAEARYAKLARAYDTARERMMTANATVGQLSKAESKAAQEVAFYEKQAIALKNARLGVLPSEPKRRAKRKPKKKAKAARRRTKRKSSRRKSSKRKR